MIFNIIERIGKILQDKYAVQTYKEDTYIINVLDHITIQLQAYYENDKKDQATLESLKEIILGIEHIYVTTNQRSRFLSYSQPEVLGDFLKRKNNQVLSNDQAQIPSPNEKIKTTLEDISMLEHIHSTLMQYYLIKSLQDPIWVCYSNGVDSVDEKDMINKVIQFWQTSSMNLPQKVFLANELKLIDRNRGFHIEDKVIERLNQAATKDEKLLAKWFGYYHGQELFSTLIKTLTDPLLGHDVRSEEDYQYVVGKTEILNGVWFINDENQIACHYELLIYSITQGPDRLIVKDQEIKNTKDQRCAVADFLEKNKKNLQPILYINANVWLTFEGSDNMRKVKPNIEFTLTSYTTYIRDPRVQNVKQNEELTALMDSNEDIQEAVPREEVTEIEENSEKEDEFSGMINSINAEIAELEVYLNEGDDFSHKILPNKQVKPKSQSDSSLPSIGYLREYLPSWSSKKDTTIEMVDLPDDVEISTVTSYQSMNKSS